MKKVFIVLAGCLLVSFGAWAQEIELSSTGAPQLIQVTGTSDIFFEPTRYPNFVSYSSDNPSCGNYLRDSLSNQLLSTSAVGCQGCAGGNYADHSGAIGYAPIADLTLSIDETNIPSENRNSANILVTWTVRIEGFKVETYDIWPRLCEPWHGTSVQQFDAGTAKTALFIRYDNREWEKASNDFVMTVPTAGSGIDIQPSDPTQSGSYLLTPDRFEGGVFPAQMQLQVRWLNDTSMRLKSPANMRALMATVVPAEGN